MLCSLDRLAQLADSHDRPQAEDDRGITEHGPIGDNGSANLLTSFRTSIVRAVAKTVISKWSVCTISTMLRGLCATQASLLGYLDIAGAGNRSPPFEIRRDDARKLFR